MSDINFVTTDAAKILDDLILQFETAYGQTFYPTDERRIFLEQLAQVIVGLKNDINQSARENLLKYATGNELDALGDFYNSDRIPAQKAKTTFRFMLSTAQALPITIPTGTRVTPDGKLYFATTQDLSIPIGQTTGDISAEATVGGIDYNGFAPGQIKNLVDSVPYVASVSNTDTSSGGSDIEADDDGTNIWSGYRERIRLAPESYSVAGPEGAYIYWAKTTDVNISDINVASPTAGNVTITVLMKNGQLPTQPILDAVTAVVSAKDRRPLTDNVTVAAPTEVAYNITLTYYISKERPAEETSIKSAIEGTNGSVDQYKAWQCEKLGRAINPDYLKQLMLNVGVSRVDITVPVYTAVNANQVPKVGVVTLTYGGLI